MLRQRIPLGIMAVVISALILCSLVVTLAAQQTPKIYKTQIVSTIPSDNNAFTQGLLVRDGSFYMSTGIWGESTVRKISMDGKEIQRVSLPKNVFGEGLAWLNGKFYQLTYQNGHAFTYDASLSKTGILKYPRGAISEGWGLTSDDSSLYATDGSSNIYVLDGDFKLKRVIEVTDSGSPLSGLNELEYIDGEIYANIYAADCIARIDATSGRVNSWVVGTNLFPDNSDPGVFVMNGIAVDPQSKKLYVSAFTSRVFWRILAVIMCVACSSPARSGRASSR